jgi:hypothetical protein
MRFDWIADKLNHSIVDLAGAPVYVVAADEAPRFMLPGAYGLCDVNLCWGLRPILQSRGRWQGPGFACLVVDDPNVDAPAVAIHEAGHELCRPPRSLTEQRFESLTDNTKNWVATELFDWSDSSLSNVPSRAGHELSFLRAVAHVRYRMEKLGDVLVSPLDLVPHSRYAISPFADYYKAFEPELIDRVNEPVRTIVASEMPPASAELWESDLLANPI